MGLYLGKNRLLRMGERDWRPVIEGIANFIAVLFCVALVWLIFALLPR